MSGQDFASQTVDELKEEARRRGLSVGGSKDELVQRLNEAAANDPMEPQGSVIAQPASHADPDSK